MRNSNSLKDGLLFLVAIVATIPTTKAAEVRDLSLIDCLQTALEHNLTAQIQRVNPEIAENRLGIAYATYEPNAFASYNRLHREQPGFFDPTIGTIPGTETDTDRVNAGVSGTAPTGLTYSLSGNVSSLDGLTPFRERFQNTSGGASLNLRQPLLKNMWIDSNRLNIRLRKNELQISELELAWRLMNIITQVELSYYDLIFAIENVKVQEKAVQLAERLLSENKKRVEVGALAPLDEKQSESQAASRRADLLGAQRTLATRQNALKNLLSDDFVQWANVTINPTDHLRAVPLAIDLQDSWHKGMSERPDLLQSRINVEQQGVIIRFNKNQLFPQLDAVGSIGYSASVDNSSYNRAFGQIRSRDNPIWSLGAELSVPLGNRAARNNYRIAQAQKKQLVLQLKQFEQDIMVNIENAVTLVQINLQRVEATRQEREFSEAALDAEQKKLANGKNTSFFVLQLQRDLTAASSSEIQALSEYNKAQSQLALEEGNIFNRHQIDVEVE